MACDRPQADNGVVNHSLRGENPVTGNRIIVNLYPFHLWPAIGNCPIAEMPLTLFVSVKNFATC